MADLTLIPHTAPVTPFDPEAWLFRFLTIGGYVATVGDKPALGAIEQPGAGIDPDTALSMLNAAWADDAKRASIRECLFSSVGGDHGHD